MKLYSNYDKIYKSSFIYFIFISLSFNACTIQKIALVNKKSDFDIYLLIGQSNMAGRAKITKKHSGIIKNAFLFNDKYKWVPAKAPFNIYSTIKKDIKYQKLNPAYSFILTMQKSTKNKIGLVVNARGGSSLKEWEKGSKYYNEAIKRCKAAMKTGTLKGILWHQGESDEKNKKYLDQLIVFIKNIRQDLGNKKLPFIVGQINNVKLINKQLLKISNKVPFSACVSSKGLRAFDRWHFDTKSQIILGQRYGKAMLKLR